MSYPIGDYLSQNDEFCLFLAPCEIMESFFSEADPLCIRIDGKLLRRQRANGLFGKNFSKRSYFLVQ